MLEVSAQLRASGSFKSLVSARNGCVCLVPIYLLVYLARCEIQPRNEPEGLRGGSSMWQVLSSGTENGRWVVVNGNNTWFDPQLLYKLCENHSTDGVILEQGAYFFKTISFSTKEKKWMCTLN